MFLRLLLCDPNTVVIEYMLGMLDMYIYISYFTDRYIYIYNILRLPQVENGSDVNAVENGGSTALHVAVRRGHVPLAAALVRRGGDLTVLDRHGRSPLELVKREQDVEDIAVGHFKAAERAPMLVGTAV